MVLGQVYFPEYIGFPFDHHSIEVPYSFITSLRCATDLIIKTLTQPLA